MDVKGIRATKINPEIESAETQATPDSPESAGLADVPNSIENFSSNFPNYREWEANRKEFLYPENWLEPELRPSESGLAEALDAELLKDLNSVDQYQRPAAVEPSSDNSNDDSHKIKTRK